MVFVDYLLATLGVGLGIVATVAVMVLLAAVVAVALLGGDDDGPGVA